jgi:hypothetical protein
MSQNPTTHILQLILLAAVAQGCQPKLQTSRLRMAPLDAKADNHALLIGAPNDLKGVPRDLENMSQALSEFAFNYSVTKINEAKRDQILDALATVSARVSERGTLLVYLSGHGTPEGLFVTQGNNVGGKPTDPKSEYISFSEIIGAIERGRMSGGSVRPLAYLQIFGDFCFSGKWVSGDNRSDQTKIQSQTYQFTSKPSESSGNENREIRPNSTKPPSDGSTPQEYDPYAQVASLEQLHAHVTAGMQAILDRALVGGPSIRFIRNYLLVAASSPNQVAIDNGKLSGGLFTSTLIAKIHELRSRISDPTLGDLLDATSQETESRQKLTYNVSNPKLLDVRLLSDHRPDITIDPNPEPPMSKIFSFSIAFDAKTNNQAFMIKNIKNCDASDIKWTIRLINGQPCIIKDGTCSFATQKPFDDVSVNLPDARKSFTVTGLCGSATESIQVQIGSVTYDADKDGIDDAIDLCTSTPAGAKVQTSGPRIGCREGELSDLEDADHDGVKNNEDVCPQTPAGKSVASTGARKGCAPGDRTKQELNAETLLP